MRYAPRVVVRTGVRASGIAVRGSRLAGWDAGVAARSGPRHGAAVAARMCARSEAVELEVLGAEGGEARVPPRPLRLSLLELLGKLVRRDQPAAPRRRARHNHRFRTFVACGPYSYTSTNDVTFTFRMSLCGYRFLFTSLTMRNVLCYGKIISRIDCTMSKVVPSDSRHSAALARSTAGRAAAPWSFAYDPACSLVID